MPHRANNLCKNDVHHFAHLSTSNNGEVCHTPSFQRSGQHNNQHEPLPTEKDVGLREQLCTTVLEWQDSLSEVHHQSGTLQHNSFKYLLLSWLLEISNKVWVFLLEVPDILHLLRLVSQKRTFTGLFHINRAHIGSLCTLTRVNWVPRQRICIRICLSRSMLDCRVHLLYCHGPMCKFGRWVGRDTQAEWSVKATH